jgi:cytosine/adenosine deaminase-related metal-dependent hydrolase
LAKRENKPLHIHVDQRNDPRENGSEIVLDLVESFNFSANHKEEPKIWLVHVISPSLYEENRFQILLEKIRANNVGVICCPSAAISMRQLRVIKSPTCNSLARVLDMLAAGIHLRLGSDNIFDVTSPAGTIDLINEVFVLSNALRFYDQDIMAKICAGQKINETEIEKIRAHLEKDDEEVNQSIKNYYPD